MEREWITFETVISLAEMLTSCFFAAGLFEKEVRTKRDGGVLFLFAFCGAVMYTLRETVFLWVPDFVPSLVIFTLYGLIVCHGRLWSVLLWALLNYLFIGVIVISMGAVIGIISHRNLDVFEATTIGRVMGRVITRLMQILLSEIILKIMKRFREPVTVRKKETSLIAVTMVSIAALVMLWNAELSMTEETVYYFNLFICLSVLVLNFLLLFFKEILSKEKHANRELKEQNDIIRRQLRNQDEIDEAYKSMRALRHDINSHLHAIAGYIQVEDYKKVKDYVEKIAGEVNAIEQRQSGNSALDALLGSKNALAQKNGIRLDTDIAIPDSMKISDEHLVVVVGNLYDNAIDANLKIEEAEKRFIRIRMQYRNEELLLLFENAAKESGKREGGGWLTSKKDAFWHGFGIRNIDRVVQLYGGYSQREWKDYVFSCKIRIPDVERKEAF